MHSLDKDKHAAEMVQIEQLSKLLGDAVDTLAKTVHALAVKNGFWESSPNDGEKLMLIVSELGEGLEALRHGNPPSEHIPEFSAIEEEMADVVIRVMDLCEGRGWRLGEALLAKHAYNLTRPFRHNKAF